MSKAIDFAKHKQIKEDIEEMERALDTLNWFFCMDTYPAQIFHTKNKEAVETNCFFCGEFFEIGLDEFLAFTMALAYADYKDYETNGCAIMHYCSKCANELKENGSIEKVKQA